MLRATGLVVLHRLQVDTNVRAVLGGDSSVNCGLEMAGWSWRS